MFFGGKQLGSGRYLRCRSTFLCVCGNGNGNDIEQFEVVKAHNVEQGAVVRFSTGSLTHLLNCFWATAEWIQYF